MSNFSRGFNYFKGHYVALGTTRVNWETLASWEKSGDEVEVDEDAQELARKPEHIVPISLSVNLGARV